MTPFSPKVVRIIRTLNIYLSFFGLGLCVSITGPTLIDLARNIGKDTEHMAYVLASRSAAYLGGSIIGGLLLDRFNRQLLLTLCVFVIGVTSLAIPWWTSFWALIANVFVSGLFMGALDTGGNVLCLDLWQENNGPFMQALHCFFGLGAFVGPLVAEPFLSPSSDQKPEALLSNYNNSLSSFSNSSASDQENTIVYSYAIASSYLILIGISFMLTYFCNREDIKREDKETAENGRSNGPRFVIGVMMAITVMISLYGGIEFSLGQLLTVYSVKSDLNLSTSTGSYITSVFWAGFTFFRGFGILVAVFVRPWRIAFVDYLAMVAAGLTLVLWGDVHEYALWIGAAVFGMGMASTYAAVYAWLGEHIFITNRLASCFTVAGVAGEMIMPIVIGLFIETRPSMLVFCVMGCTLASFLTFLGLTIFLRWWGGSRSHNETGVDLKDVKRDAPSSPTMLES